MVARSGPNLLRDEDYIAHHHCYSRNGHETFICAPVITICPRQTNSNPTISYKKRYSVTSLNATLCFVLDENRSLDVEMLAQQELDRIRHLAMHPGVGDFGAHNKKTPACADVLLWRGGREPVHALRPGTHHPATRNNRKRGFTDY